MRYQTGGYYWHSKPLFWLWWTCMITAIMGTFTGAILHADVGLYYAFILVAAMALVFRAMDGRMPQIDGRPPVHFRRPVEEDDPQVGDEYGNVTNMEDWLDQNTDVVKPRVDRVFAPWTIEQVEALNHFQGRSDVHAFHCDNLTCVGGDKTRLIATRDGWICGMCTYALNWAYDFMMEKK